MRRTRRMEGGAEPLRPAAAHSARWRAGLLVLLSVLAANACRRNRFPSRGDAAAVVVVVPRNDAAGPPKIAEQEPNDIPDQAQVLAFHPDRPQCGVEGEISGSSGGKTKDVDVFKLLVPSLGQDAAVRTVALDSALPDDPRMSARRLSVEVASDGGAPLSLQLLDDGLKSLETISVEPGEMAGMPNMAAWPGHLYYLRVKALAKPGKTQNPPPPGSPYKLTVQLGDFEITEEREPNGGLETAQPLGLTGTTDFAGLFGWQRDQDFYRIPAPDVVSALDMELDAVEGVAAGLQVQDSGGARIAVARGRRGERLALRNVTLSPAAADAGANARVLYVVVRSEAGHNRTQRYVLHLTSGALKRDAEIEPNDNPASATEVRDGTTTGFLSVGDVDYFHYVGDGQREVSFEVACPSRVRAKLEVVRPSDGQVLGAAEAKKARQSVVLSKIPSLGEPLLVRLGQGKGDGNPNEPYSLTISSSPRPIEKNGVTNSP